MQVHFLEESRNEPQGWLGRMLGLGKAHGGVELGAARWLQLVV